MRVTTATVAASSVATATVPIITVSRAAAGRWRSVLSLCRAGVQLAADAAHCSPLAGSAAGHFSTSRCAAVDVRRRWSVVEGDATRHRCRRDAADDTDGDTDATATAATTATWCIFSDNICAVVDGFRQVVGPIDGRCSGPWQVTAG